MPNEILFSGGRRETISIVAGTVTESTTAGTFNATYSDCSLLVSGATPVFSAKLYTETSGALSTRTISGAGSRLFVHAVVYFESSSFVPSNRMIQLVDSSGFAWFGIRAAGVSGADVSAMQIRWNSGTGASPVWTDIVGDPTPVPTSTAVPWDIEFIFGSPHVVKVYINNSLWKSGTFTQASFTNIAEVQFGGFSSSGTQPNLYFSEILITENISTIGAFVSTERPTGIGSNVGFTNNNTAVNEVVVNDATLQSAGTAGLRTTHVMSDVVVPSGLNIGAVFLWMRARNNGIAPNNIRSVLRSGGIDYVTPNISLISAAYSPVGARYNLDVLGVAWTEAEWNGIEAGYEAAT